MEAIDHLKSVVEKFNAAKSENLNYPAHKDTALSEAVALADEFIKASEPVKEEVKGEEVKVEEPKAE